jgi:NAD dependent epimerase/dehydratase family enzyme
MGDKTLYLIRHCEATGQAPETHLTSKGEQQAIELADFLMDKNAIENEKMSGIYNATGPNPVTNKEFMKALRKSINRGWSPPAPAPLVKIGAYLIMRADPSLALTGRNCTPKRLLESGFKFKYTDLEDALEDLVN